MDKKQVYCRYCGKLIDEDALFCTYCGKEQNADTTKAKSLVPDMSDKIEHKYSHKLKRMNWTKIKKWLKRILILVIILIVVLLMVWLGFWLYGSHLASEWTKEDVRREAIAINDITKADEIAREFFKESAEYAHQYRLGCYECCEFDHIERGVAILRNAAEKGNADAQFTLGAIYNGCRYDLKEPYFDESLTMLGGDIDLERAAYWYTLAAKQGHVVAMFNLANAYRFGSGVEKNLIKATELMKIAAEKEYSSAQLVYGDMFRDGEVCVRVETDSIKGDTLKPNIRLAKEWWTKALRNGNKKARKRLEQLYE